MSEIIHKTEPIEHWIVDGKAYRLATEGDIDKFVYRSDRSIERALEAKQERLASVWVGNELRFECRGFKWRFAYIQDDSLLQPNGEVDLVEFEVKRTPVPALGEDWYLLTVEDGVFKKGDKANASLTDDSSWVNCDCIRGKSIKEWIEGNCRAARYFGQTKFEHVVDCVTVDERIVQKIQDDAAMRQASQPQPKPIDWTKPVRTKDGRAVRVLCTDGPGDYPVCGYIDGERNPRSWTLDGYLHINERHSTLDLENAPRRVKKTWWMNVFDDGSFDHYETKELADSDRGRGIFACVPFPIDCEEGEGL